MKPPRVSSAGNIPGTEWHVGCRYLVSKLSDYAEELGRVIKWCRQEEKWARWKARKKRGV